MVEECGVFGATVGAALPWIAGGLAIASLLGGDLFGEEEANPELYFSTSGISNQRAGQVPYIRNTEFGAIAVTGQHLDNNGANIDIKEVAEKILTPLEKLDSALAAMLSASEITDIKEALTGATGQHLWDTVGGFDVALSARLKLITGAIGGWVGDLSNTVTGSLEEMYTQVIGIISLREDESAQAIAESLLGGDGAAYIKEGETAASAFIRLQTALVGVNGILEQINKSALDVSLAGADAAYQLVMLFGSMENLSSKTAAYYESYFTEEERAARTIANLEQAFAGINMVMPQTKSELRNIVESLDLTTESGRQAYVTIMNLAPTFAEAMDNVLAYIQNIQAGTRSALQATYDKALASVEQAQQDLLRVYEEQANTFESSISRFEDLLKSLQAFRQSLLVGQYSPYDPLAKYTEARTQFEDIAARAASGDTEAAEQLQSFAERFLDESKNYYASSPQYETDFQSVMSAIDGTEASVTSQLDAARLALAELEAQSELLRSLNDTALTMDEALSNLEEAMTVLNQALMSLVNYTGVTPVSEADRIWSAAGWERNIASNQALAEATGYTGNFNGLEEFTNYLSTQDQSIQDLAQSVAQATGRAPLQIPEDRSWSAAGWERNAASNQALAQATGYTGGFNGLDEFQQFLDSQSEVSRAVANSVMDAYGRTPKFARGGVANGWAIVGENGPELANFGQPTRIYTADDTRSMLRPAANEGDSEYLIAVIAELQALIRQNGVGTQAMLDELRQVKQELEEIRSKTRMRDAA